MSTDVVDTIDVLPLRDDASLLLEKCDLKERKKNSAMFEWESVANTQGNLTAAAWTRMGSKWVLAAPVLHSYPVPAQILAAVLVKPTVADS